MSDELDTKRPDGEVRVLRDLSYGTVDGKPRLADLFLPIDKAAPLPVVLFLHGGGWAFGDRHLTPDLQRFFARSGIAMASIDYRLSSEAIFPAPVEDVRTAIRWLRSVAAEHNIDPTRIGLWGSSAGSHLGVLSQTLPTDVYRGHEHDNFSDKVQAVVDGYGPTDLLQSDAHRDPNAAKETDPESIQIPAGKKSSDADSFESKFIGAPIETVPELVERANPITYIDATPVPPLLILHGLADAAVPAHQSQILFEALALHGHEATLGLIEGLGHGFFNRNDLDEAGPRTVHMTRTLGGATAKESSEQHRIYGLVEAFFRDKLRC